MNSAIDKLNELKESIRDADTEDFHAAADHWVVMLERIVEELEEDSEKKDDRIRALAVEVHELEVELDAMDDPDEVTIEVSTLPDQMKLAHIEEVFHQYSLEEIELYLPKRYF